MGGIISAQINEVNCFVLFCFKLIQIIKNEIETTRQRKSAATVILLEGELGKFPWLVFDYDPAFSSVNNDPCPNVKSGERRSAWWKTDPLIRNDH